MLNTTALFALYALDSGRTFKAACLDFDLNDKAIPALHASSLGAALTKGPMHKNENGGRFGSIAP